MSKKSTYLLGILLIIIIGSLLNWYFCCSVCYKKQTNGTDKQDNKIITNNTVKPKEKSPTFNPFSVKDLNGNLSFSTNDNFNFKESNFVFVDSISTNINNGILDVKQYLAENDQKRFNITGFYTSNEINNSAYPNLGVARANNVKNYMASKGIPSKLINTFGKQDNQLIPNKDGIYLGPITYNIFTRTATVTNDDKALKMACEAIKSAPLKFYFKTGKSQINLTKEQRQKMVTISKCVDKLGFTINVVGHTDNTGLAENNMILGLRRANFVREYLVQNGILAKNIKATSKGQNVPISNNATLEGRAQNRRIEVTIN